MADRQGGVKYIDFNGGGQEAGIGVVGEMNPQRCDCVVEKFKQSSYWVMVCGSIMKGKKGPFVILEYPGSKGGGMNATRYRQQVLKPHLLNFYMEMLEERGLVAF